jgi:hypothetical protein
MDDPSVLYWFGSALLLPCVAAGAIFFCHAPFGAKVLALVPELIALAFVVAVAHIPDLGHRRWVGGVVLGMAIAAAFVSYLVLRKPRV